MKCKFCDDCKKDVEEIIESMAYEIAKHRYCHQSWIDSEQVQDIMKEFGWK